MVKGPKWFIWLFHFLAYQQRNGICVLDFSGRIREIQIFLTENDRNSFLNSKQKFECFLSEFSNVKSKFEQKKFSQKF